MCSLFCFLVLISILIVIRNSTLFRNITFAAYLTVLMIMMFYLFVYFYAGGREGIKSFITSYLIKMVEMKYNKMK